MKATPSREALEALGLRRMSPLKAIRKRCLECTCGSAREVALCPSRSCPNWPFRFGSDPWSPPRSQQQGKGIDENGRSDRARTTNRP